MRCGGDRGVVTSKKEDSDLAAISEDFRELIQSHARAESEELFARELACQVRSTTSMPHCGITR